MSYDLLVRGRVVTPSGRLDRGWLAVRRGVVAALGEGEAPEAAEVHDAGEAFVLPGGVDAQTHAGSYWGLPGLEPTSRGAIAGGITTMVEMPFDSPTPLSTLELFRAKVEAIERLSYCDVALYGTAAPGQSTGLMPKLAEAGVCGFKISVCESHPVRFPRIPADQVLAMFEMCAALHLPLAVHNEDQEIVRARTAIMRASGCNTLDVHSESRPEAAELAATAAFLELGAVAGAQAHIVHISSKRGFDLLDRYRREGHRVTGEICVHYLLFDPAVEGARLDARIKVNPPLRPDMREALWEEVRSGHVTCISSDHSTMSLQNKMGGSIFDAGPGIPGIESLIPAFYTGLEAHGLDGPRGVAAHIAEKPAKLFGLWPKKGAILPGSDADLVVLEPGRFVYDSSQAHDGVNWSPYDGMAFTVRVVASYVRGRRVWDGRTVVGDPGHGSFQPRISYGV